MAQVKDTDTITGKYTIAGTFKADADSTEKKSFTLRFNFSNVRVKDIIASSLADKKIAWVNNNRKNYGKVKNNAIIDVEYTAPGVAVKSREEQIEELSIQFQKAGLGKEQALELATKAVDNPEIIS